VRRPLSGKQQDPPVSRRDRRRADRRARYDAARDERRGRSSGGGSSFLSGRYLTLGAVIVGVLLIGFLAVGQLGDKATDTFIDPAIEYPVALVDGTTLGAKDAPVTLEVYEDFQCPVCARYSLTVEPQLVTKYVLPGTLRIVHHDIAILGNRTPNDESKIAAVGASCASDQNRYWDYSHWVYANQAGENSGGFAPERLTAIAQAAGVDVSGFPACLEDSARVVAVAQTTGDAGTRGINSTPTLAINGQLLQPGIPPVDQLGTLIEAVAAASPAPGGSPAGSPSAAP
jgi:protein-disulfide isomerase